MGPGEWVAIAGIAVTAAIALVGLVIQGFISAFHFGKHSQRIASLEEKTRDMNTASSLVATIAATLDALKNQVERLDEVIASRIDRLETELRGALAGKPGRRPPP